MSMTVLWFDIQTRKVGVRNYKAYRWYKSDTKLLSIHRYTGKSVQKKNGRASLALSLLFFTLEFSKHARKICLYFGREMQFRLPQSRFAFSSTDCLHWLHRCLPKLMNRNKCEAWVSLLRSDVESPSGCFSRGLHGLESDTWSSSLVFRNWSDILSHKRLIEEGKQTDSPDSGMIDKKNKREAELRYSSSWE